MGPLLRMLLKRPSDNIAAIKPRRTSVFGKELEVYIPFWAISHGKEPYLSKITQITSDFNSSRMFIVRVSSVVFHIKNEKCWLLFLYNCCKALFYKALEIVPVPFKNGSSIGQKCSYVVTGPLNQSPQARPVIPQLHK